MKKLDKSYEEIKDDFSYLGRKEFYNSIIESLKNYEQNYTLALNGIWGSGKTILVKRMLDDINTDKSKLFGLYYNAWENDYFESPLLSFLNRLLEDKEFIDVLETSVKEETELSLNTSIKIGALTASIKQRNRTDELLSNIKYSKQSLEVISKLLQNYIANKEKKLIVFIDELDRCNPEFALKLLEQFKHLRVESIVFFYIIDNKQLNLSIKSYYGSDYNTSTFMYKFFDEIISLPNLEDRDMLNYLKYHLPKNEMLPEVNTDVILQAINVLEVSLRDLNRASNYMNKLVIFSGINGLKDESIINCTTLVVLSLLRIKHPEIIREALLKKTATTNLINKIEEFTELHGLFDYANNKNPNKGYSVSSYITKLFERPEIRSSLF